MCRAPFASRENSRGYYGDKSEASLDGPRLPDRKLFRSAAGEIGARRVSFRFDESPDGALSSRRVMVWHYNELGVAPGDKEPDRAGRKWSRVEAFLALSRIH